MLRKEGIFIGGIQQLGLGVLDAEAVFESCSTIFGMDARIFEEESDAAVVERYTGGKAMRRRIILAANLNGGGALEIWQHLQREPQPVRMRLGATGILLAKIKSFDIITSYKSHREAGYKVSELLTNPIQGRHYYLQDDWGNRYDITDFPIDRFTYIPNAAETGGLCGAILGVSDMERSIQFYRQILNYDHLVFDEVDCFSDLSGLPGGDQKVRRVLLEMSSPTQGPFSQLLGRSRIELIQGLDQAQPHLYHGRYNGDPGFFHISYDIQGMDKLEKVCTAAGHPFTVDSRDTYELGEAGGRFAYIEDPDGTLIQFVETHRVALLEPGLVLDLRKRDPAKPLPRFILQGLRMSRRG